MFTSEKAMAPKTPHNPNEWVILSLDPSKNRTGWAVATIPRVWNEGNYYELDVYGLPTQFVKPHWQLLWRKTRWAWGYWDLSCKGLMARMDELCLFIISEVGHFDQYVAEWPVFYDVARGHMAAMKGDTINLAAIVSYVAGYFRMPSARTYIVTAPNWKGSVSKAITQKRFYDSFGINHLHAIDHNAVDATMLLLTYAQRERLLPPEWITAQKWLDPHLMPTWQGKPSDTARFIGR